MSGITSHVLDTSRGVPAEGIVIELAILSEDGSWQPVGSGVTNSDGRVADLTRGDLNEGHYRVGFGVAEYFEKLETKCFYPAVQIEFLVGDESQHYHVPLLLNPFGYSTYRGS